MGQSTCSIACQTDNNVVEDLLGQILRFILYNNKGTAQLLKLLAQREISIY